MGNDPATSVLNRWQQAHDVGPVARCRWPWTFTASAGTFSSGRCVSTSGGSVAHNAVRQVLWKPGRRSAETLRSLVAEDQESLARAFG